MSLSGHETGPLSGRRILVTRAREQAGTFSARLREQGAEVVEVPTIRFSPPDSWETLDGALARLGCYSLILFTSANGVEGFFRRLQSRGVDPAILSDRTLVAIGPKTDQKLRHHGLRADVVPESYLAEGILEGLKGLELGGHEVLIPRAQEGRDVLIAGLERRGARVTVAPVYRTVCAEESRRPLLEVLESRGVDMVTFTASSAVHYFVDLVGAARISDLLRGVRVACLGPVTAAAARSRGILPDLIASRSTSADLAAAIVRHFARAGDPLLPGSAASPRRRS